MKFLFLHGRYSIVGGVKPTYLKDSVHEVVNPALDNDNFAAAVRTAQAEYDQHQPDVVVGSSRGGAVAVNIKSEDTPLVLLCPAWKNWGTATTIKPNSVILHSHQDDVIPFSDSQELVADRGLQWTRSLKSVRITDCLYQSQLKSSQNRRAAGGFPRVNALPFLEPVI